MVTPYAWSKPHPVNDHVAGSGRRAPPARPRRRRPRAVESRRASSRADAARCGASFATARRSRAWSRSGRPSRSRAATGWAFPSGPREPAARALRRPLRHRPRPRPRRSERLVSRAPRPPRARGGDVPLAGAPDLPAGQGAAQEAARPHRRADRDERGRARGGARALPRRRTSSCRRGSTPAVSRPGRPRSGSSRVARRRTPTGAARRCARCGPPRLGGRRPADAPAVRAARRAPRAPGADDRADGARRGRARRRAPGRGGLRSVLGRLVAGAPGGRGRGRVR